MCGCIGIEQSGVLQSTPISLACDPEIDALVLHMVPHMQTQVILLHTGVGVAVLFLCRMVPTVLTYFRANQRISEQFCIFTSLKIFLLRSLMYV